MINKNIRLRFMLFALLPLNAFTQGLIITNGGRMNVSGTAHLVLNGSKFINNGNFVPGAGTVVFMGKGGNGETVIGGSQTTTFNNLTVNIAPGLLRIDKDVVINNILTMQQGNVHLNTHTVALGATGRLAGESAQSFITDISAAGNGKVLATGTLNNGVIIQPGNMGMELTSNSVGKRTVNIERTHSAVALGNGGQGIRRNFSVSSPGILSLAARVRFFYLDPELNGNVENTLILWSTSGAGNFLVPLGKDSSNSVANWVVKNDINILSFFTLANEGGVVSFNQGSNSASVEKSVVKGGLSVFPNPARSNLTMSLFSKESGDATTSIVNTLGKPLYQRNIHLSQGMNNIPFDIHSYPAGIYYLLVQGKDYRFVKVVKE